MQLQSVFTTRRIKVGLESEDKDELFEELVELLDRDGGKDFPRTAVLTSIREREQKMSTGIKKGIAIPHGKAAGITGLIGAIGISRRGVDYDALDGEPVFIVFMLISSPEDSELHLSALKRLAGLLDDPEFYAELARAETPERAFAVLKSYEDVLHL
jgi:nitrogen PTS system EIIA component